MKFSVVICTFNRRHVLERTLPTVLQQDFPSEGYEVIVVVDGSEDGTTAMLRALAPARSLTVLEQSNKGPALARNAGLAAASGDIVLIIDDDIICAPDLLASHLHTHLAAARPAVVFGPVLVAPDSAPTAATWWTKAYTDEYVARLERERLPRWPRDMVMEANYSAPRATLLENGGYHPDFPSREGAEFGLRLHARGLPFIFEPRARVWQLFVKTPLGVVRDAWHYGRAEVKLTKTYPEYRRHSMMARISEGRVMPLARSAAARLPFSAEPLLRPLALGASLLGESPQSQRRAVRILNLRKGVPALRGAAAEAGSWTQLRHDFGATLPVLIFHHVGPRDPDASPALTVSGEKFTRMMRWLARHGYLGISPSQWLDWVDAGVPLPAKPILLTFDDAFADLAEHAFPVLRQYGFSAGVFVVTGQVGGINAWDQGMAVWRCLDASQIREWSAQGIEFGAHTRTHADLTRLSARQMEDEIAGSRKELEDILGQAVASFAYPFGNLNEAAIDCVRRHYDLAFSCIEGLNSLATELHILRRTMVLPSDLPVDLALRALLGSSPLHALKARLRVRTRLRSLLGRHN